MVREPEGTGMGTGRADSGIWEDNPETGGSGSEGRRGKTFLRFRLLFPRQETRSRKTERKMPIGRFISFINRFLKSV
jgi:hypothetical protein